MRKETIQSDIFALMQAKTGADPIYAAPYPIDPSYGLITCRPTFGAPTGSVFLNESFDCYLTVRVAFPQRLTFSKVVVQFTDSAYNITVLPSADKKQSVSMSLSSFLDGGDSKQTASPAPAPAYIASASGSGGSDIRYEDLTFNPRETKIFTFSLKARAPTSFVPLQCTTVLFYCTRQQQQQTSSQPQPSLVFQCSAVDDIASDGVGVMAGTTTATTAGSLNTSIALPTGQVSAVKIVAARPKYERSDTRLRTHRVTLQRLNEVYGLLCVMQSVD